MELLLSVTRDETVLFDQGVSKRLEIWKMQRIIDWYTDYVDCYWVIYNFDSLG